MSYRNKIIQGDVLDVLKTLPDGIVQTVVTSPPYWGLRDYSVDGQLGLEATPELYVEKMIEVFREIWRILRNDGTVWLNLGDSYIGSWGNSGSRAGGQRARNEKRIDRKAWDNNIERPASSYSQNGLKPKDLCGIPWRVAFALQADGWYLRSDIIWSKPNPMPESVTDRPTKSHEYLFLLTKKAKYYYDATAIREKSSPETWGLNKDGNYYGNDTKDYKSAKAQSPSNIKKRIAEANNGTRNRRSVWEIATQPYSEAHFATFPEKLVEPCILAGSAEKACGVCGAPWERVTDIKQEIIGKSVLSMGGDAKRSSRNRDDHPQQRTKKHVTTLCFRPTCEHDNGESKSIVMDIFSGSGTVAKVALRANRDFIGIELHPEYIKMSMKRIEPLLRQGGLAL